MHLIALSLEEWQQERRWEAAHHAYRVRFANSGTLALFLDSQGKHLLYSRSYEDSPNVKGLDRRDTGT